MPSLIRRVIVCRRKPKMIEFLPEPGPGEYSPGDATLVRSPAYTVRDKLSRELDPPPYPGPGHYDVEDSTIGNWGAGMAAHVPENPNLFLRERIEVFRRGAEAATDKEFLNGNRRELLRMREQELRGGGNSSKLGETSARTRARKQGKAKPKSPAGSASIMMQPLYVDT